MDLWASPGSGHIQSMAPVLWRRVPVPEYQRERLELADGDFLDLDWLRAGYPRLAIVSHGLEGSSHRDYVKGLARELHAQGWDVLAWNMRGCSGTPNRLLTWYHSGQSADLKTVIDHAIAQESKPIALVGFSIGGNITLKYLGETRNQVPENIRAVVTLSVPTDLAGSAHHLAHWSKNIYMRYLLEPLFQRLEEKSLRFPDLIDIRGLRQIKSFLQFDSRYTAPLHGFSSTQEYWARTSCGPLLKHITIPTLLINARNDPFLTRSCYPVEAARKNPSFHLEVPKSGGHVGFLRSRALATTWAEARVVEYLEQFDWGEA